MSDSILECGAVGCGPERGKRGLGVTTVQATLFDWRALPRDGNNQRRGDRHLPRQ
jgi:hypothetical protein